MCSAKRIKNSAKSVLQNYGIPGIKSQASKQLHESEMKSGHVFSAINSVTSYLEKNIMIEFFERKNH